MPSRSAGIWAASSRWIGSLLAATTLAAQQPADPPAPVSVYSGRRGELGVRPPRLDAEVVLDGNLDESVWRKAAVLTGFSQYRPVDGRPADDSTEVLVWYSPTAIYFGIRAFEAHGLVHATLANRDRIANDDYVQILLDTFNDHRRALVFGVNPLGVQSDGTISEGVQALTGGLGTAPVMRDTVDLSADFVFQSKGRLTPQGYEVEIRIPFKSLRYQATAVQSWGINVDRKVQHSGYEDTWTPVRQAAASFLGQSGALLELRDLSRGLVFEVNPEATGKLTGAPQADGWGYDAARPELGGNVRWGVTNNLTLNGTVNPDFSQVEADVQQISYDPRSAVFFPETRPFFVTGNEPFVTPNQLIYTRRIVNPVAAAKLSGKLSGTDVGIVSAVDDASLSAGGVDHPIYNMLRLRRDLGRQSTAGLAYTDKVDGSNYNRVVGADVRLAFAKLYALRVQGVESFTRTGGRTTSGPLWQATLDRSGRRFGLHYDLLGFHPDFVAAGGFVRRTDLVTASIAHRLIWLGRPGATVERWTAELRASLPFTYHGFLSGDLPTDPKLHLTNSVTLRGGWQIGATALLESFKYDPRLFANYWIERTLSGGGRDTVRYVGTDRIRNIGSVIDLVTPRFARFSGALNLILSQDEDFLEWSPAFDVFITASLDWQPSAKLRVNARYVRQQYLRRSDWTTVQNRQIPRLKIEYQLSRPLFLRLVGQYDARVHADLRDDSRTNFPVLLYNSATMTYRRAVREVSNDFRVDWLFSYRPTPGTVVFLGYGTSLTETDTFTLRDLHRVSDGFFVKLSYLFRL